MAKVKIKNLTKKAGTLCPIFNVNLEVADKEFVSLLAPSGSGKTTVLRCVAGLETPDEGEIYIGDELVNDLTPAERDIAMVFQTYALYPNLSVYENLASPLRAKNAPQAEVDRSVKEVAKILGISHLLDRRPMQLSGGEMQRVAIGRAIIRRPRVYLLDEPLTNLDAKLRVHMRAELKRLQRELGQTMIYATHDEFEALGMSDRLVVMRWGRIVQHGTPNEVFNNPKNIFVATFVGTPTINLFDCSLVEREGEAYLESEEFSVDISDFIGVIKDKASGTELVLGVRPSDFEILTEKPSKNSIPGEIYVLEPMGAITVIDVKVGGKLVKVKVPGAVNLALGTKVWLTFNRDKMHVFDKKTGETLI
ncbi:TPA: ABC transporter ATP-binding protein [Candidatus Bathyarchaeota archaeon]|nr:ABC transporter ATP-binding protein [Candidatus Bathyarchaeota archaeon]